MYDLTLRAFRTLSRVVLGVALLGVPNTLHASDWLREELSGDISRAENCKRRAVNVAHRLEDALGLSSQPDIDDTQDDYVEINDVGPGGHDVIIACDFEEDLRTMSVKYVGVVTVKAGKSKAPSPKKLSRRCIRYGRMPHTMTKIDGATYGHQLAEARINIYNTLYL